MSFTGPRSSDYGFYGKECIYCMSLFSYTEVNGNAKQDSLENTLLFNNSLHDEPLLWAHVFAM